MTIFLRQSYRADPTRVRANLPTVPIYEITLHPRDNAMILATHGRGVWILDQLTPFQEASRAQMADGHLFAIAPVEQRNRAGFRYYGSQGDMYFLGPNPPSGAGISYWLKAKADSARILIKDGLGNQVRELKGDAMKDALRPGFNVVYWDLRLEPILGRKVPGAEPRGNRDDTGGPRVLPGDFRAALVLNGKEASSVTFTVTGDADIVITNQDRQRRFDLLKEGQRWEARLSDASVVVRTANQQLGQIKKTFFIRDEGDESDFDFSEFRKVITFRIQNVVGNVGGATTPPSETDLALWAELKTEIPTVIDQVNALVAKLKPFYQRLAEAGLYPPVPERVEKPT